MIKPNDIVSVTLTKEERILARDYAKRAEICGMSNIRVGEDRRAHMPMDDFIGIGIGELAGNKYYFKTYPYYLGRDQKNLNPHEGDSGCDTPNYRVDYKTSRADSSRLLGYHLAVRPREWHPDHTYVQILVDTYGVTDPDKLVRTGAFEIYIVGWATTDMLPMRPRTTGVFSGAYVLPVRELEPPRSLTKDMIKRYDQ